MNDPGMLQLLMAPNPKQLAKFPEIPIEKAMGAVQALKQVPPAPIAPVAATGPAVEPADALGSAIAALATHIWRAQTRMIDPQSRQPREETRRLYRHIEGAMDAFTTMGVRLSDWMDQPYDAGLPVKVLSFQPTPELTRDTVIEAVRPAVFWQDRLLQVGEVIVGIPQTSSNTTP
jgi:hypothetical protein